MAPALFARAFVGRNHHYGRVRAGSAGNHILEEFLVPWRIDDDVVPGPGAKVNLGGIDRDVLLLFFRERIKDKGILELPSLRFTTRLERFDFPFRQRASR